MSSPKPSARLTTWCAIIGYSLVASGLPLPLGGGAAGGGRADAAVAKRLAAKDRTQPFPCMDKPCGCATAEQCFTKCCCNTPAETLAWARARAVEPALLAALERRAGAGPSPRADAAEAASCCSDAAEASCCSREAAATSCCAAPEAPPEPAPEPAPELPGRRVVLRAMLACGGILAQWCGACGSLPPPPVVTALPLPLVEALVLDDHTSECHRASPDAPPPRVA